MAKAQLKTQKTKASVSEFLKSLPDKQTQKDCQQIVKMMKTATGAPAKMWGTAIIGFGDVQLKYASGRELDWFVMGFAPRKGTIALYLYNGGMKAIKPHLKDLGKHKMSGSCLHIKKLEDIDLKVLAAMMKACAESPGCGCGEC